MSSPGLILRLGLALFPRKAPQLMSHLASRAMSTQRPGHLAAAAPDPRALLYAVQRGAADAAPLLTAPRLASLHRALTARACAVAGQALPPHRLAELGLSHGRLRALTRGREGDAGALWRASAALWETREYAAARAAAGCKLRDLADAVARLGAAGSADAAVRLVAALLPFTAAHAGGADAATHARDTAAHAAGEGTLLHELVDMGRPRAALHAFRQLARSAATTPGVQGSSLQNASAAVRACASLPGRDAMLEGVELLRSCAAAGVWPGAAVYAMLLRLSLETLALEAAHDAHVMRTTGRKSDTTAIGGSVGISDGRSASDEGRILDDTKSSCRWAGDAAKSDPEVVRVLGEAAALGIALGDGMGASDGASDSEYQVVWVRNDDDDHDGWSEDGTDHDDAAAMDAKGRDEQEPDRMHGGGSMDHARRLLYRGLQRSSDKDERGCADRGDEGRAARSIPDAADDSDDDVDPLHRAFALYDSYTGSLPAMQTTAAAAVNVALITGALAAGRHAAAAWSAAGGGAEGAPPLVHVGLEALRRVSYWHAGAAARCSGGADAGPADREEAGDWGEVRLETRSDPAGPTDPPAAHARGVNYDSAGHSAPAAPHGAHAWHLRLVALEWASLRGRDTSAAPGTDEALGAARCALVARATALRVPFPGAGACALALMAAMGRTGWAPAHIRAIHRWLAGVSPAYHAATEAADTALRSALTASAAARKASRASPRALWPGEGAKGGGS